MKSSRATALLILLNMACFCAMGFLFNRWLQTRLPVVPVSPAPSALAPAPPRVETNIVTIVKTNDFRWAQLESEDYRAYIARLRSIGCPEATIRDIIIADIDGLLAPQLRQLVPRRKDLKFWQPEEAEIRNEVNQQEIAKKQQEINLQKREIIRELVGADLAAERARLAGEEDTHGRRLGFLPAEKRAAVRAILEESEREEAAFNETANPASAEDRKRQQQFYAETKARVAQHLGEDELEQFELWYSPTAANVRNATYGMNATEEEFLKMYRLQKAFDDRWQAVDQNEFLSEETRLRWEEERTGLETALRGELGTDKYAAMKRGQDPDFHELNATLTRFNLPREKAAQLYEFKRVAAAEREKVFADQSLSPRQREIVVGAIITETESALSQALGEKAFNYFKQRSQGDWLPK